MNRNRVIAAGILAAGILCAQVFPKLVMDGSGNVALNGVTITGTPAAGYVPTATSSTAATWQVAGAGSGVNTVTFSATPTFDLSLGSLQKITLTADVTSITITNGVSGRLYTWRICQDGSGNHLFAWGAAVKSGMTIGSTLSKCNDQVFSYDGTTYDATTTGVTNQ